MRRSEEKQNNASVTLKELELPKGAIITINGVKLTHEIIETIDDFIDNNIASIKKNITESCLIIASEKSVTQNLDGDFFFHIRLLFNCLEALEKGGEA